MIECKDHRGWASSYSSCPRCLVLYWEDVSEKKQSRIEELEAEKKLLFDAHSVEMVRADTLKQELERDRAYYKRLSENHAQAGEDDGVVIEALQAEVERLQKTVSEFLDAISGVPMRAIDCNQEEVDRLWRTLEKAVCHINVIVNDHINVE